jgi:hypothetical protein
MMRRSSCSGVKHHQVSSLSHPRNRHMNPPRNQNTKQLQRQACKGADAALVFVGGSMVSNFQSPGSRKDSWRPVSEGEGLDRETLMLPGGWSADDALHTSRRALAPAARLPLQM